MRKSGILMHITSLPGNYGIGTMGKNAFDFVNILLLTTPKINNLLKVITNYFITLGQLKTAIIFEVAEVSKAFK